MGKHWKAKTEAGIKETSGREVKKQSSRLKSRNLSANLLTFAPNSIRTDWGCRSGNSGHRGKRDRNAAFCEDLAGQVAAKHKARLRAFPETVFGRIAWEIARINAELNGQTMSSGKKRQNADEGCANKENKSSFNFSLWPKSKWVFRTPPNRKLNFNNAKNEDICKPVVVQTTDRGRVIYKMNEKINVNLSNFTHRQQIDIDQRYLVEEVRIVENKEEMAESMEFVAFEDDCVVADSREPPPDELEQHFLSLTCRPKKQKNRQCRRKTSEQIASNLDNNLPSSTTTTNDTPTRIYCHKDNEMELCEESFTFKFTSNDDNNSLTNGQLFDGNGKEKGTFNFSCNN